MLISHKYKFITIDIPKTGTRSYRETLPSDIQGKAFIDEQTPTHLRFYQHETANNIKTKFESNNWEWYSYFKYVTIRNPWARYASYYMWAKTFYENMLKEDLDKVPIPKKNAFLDFESSFELLEFNQKKILKQFIINEMSQDSYFMIDNTVAVDYIAQTERIDKDFEHLCKMVGIYLPIKLKHENKNPSYDYRDLYDQELIELVSEKEKHIIKNYEYKY
jgi:hypothetical protein